MERMMQSIDELKSRQADFEKALEQKEAEKLMIYQVFTLHWSSEGVIQLID
jgi:hypothetical protein